MKVSSHTAQTYSVAIKKKSTKTPVNHQNEFVEVDDRKVENERNAEHQNKRCYESKTYSCTNYQKFNRKTKRCQTLKEICTSGQQNHKTKLTD